MNYVEVIDEILFGASYNIDVKYVELQKISKLVGRQRIRLLHELISKQIDYNRSRPHSTFYIVLSNKPGTMSGRRF